MGLLRPSGAGSGEGVGESDEITAVPHLLEWLELKGCTVTVAALNTQKAAAEYTKIIPLSISQCCATSH